MDKQGVIARGAWALAHDKHLIHYAENPRQTTIPRTVYAGRSRRSITEVDHLPDHRVVASVNAGGNSGYRLGFLMESGAKAVADHAPAGDRIRVSDRLLLV